MWIVFLDISPTFERAFNAAHELGLKILWLGQGNEIPESINKLVDASMMLDELSFETISSLINNNFKTISINAFWALKDKLIPLSAKLTFEFGKNFRFPSMDLVLTTKNKIALREILKDTNYNPDFFVIKNIDLNDHFKNPFPLTTVVIKPPLGYASIGVEKVKPHEDFSEAVKRSFSVLNKISNSVTEHNVTNFNVVSTLLVEKFIYGEEYSVEVFANESGIHILGICSKSEMKPPFFEELSYCSPAQLDDSKYLKISNAALEIAKKLNLNSGMAHIELIVNNDEIKVLDIGLRLGGSGLTHDLIYLSKGIDLVKAVISEIANMDNNYLLFETSNSIALLYLLQIGIGGQIKSIPNPEEEGIKKSFPEFIKKEFFVKSNDQLIGYPNYSGLPGYVLFKIQGINNTSYQRCHEIIESAKKEIRVEYK